MLAGTQRIKDLFNNNEFEVFIVCGKNGYGKSAYCNRLLAEVYSIDGSSTNWSVPLLTQKIGFHPMKVISRWDKMKKRDYAYHWDDAGAWLHALDYQDFFVKSVGKFLQTARTKFGCIMFSCIDKADIISKIRNFKSAVLIDITKHGNIPNAPGERKFKRLATAWRYWEARSGKTGYAYEWEEPFSCKMPDKFFEWYEPVRNKYANMCIADMRIRLQEKKDIMRLSELSDI
ncbi:unnamed protein product [marine sediment metagenome]|uniref:Zona occludens toxin N-terminal domain-containing protein n=1 Tax=marine sediment metagenome TaxID=412755 RepID=X0ZK85_9ZZZZ